MNTSENLRNQGPDSREMSYFLGIVLVAGLLRLYLATLESEVGVDSVHYILMGDNIANGRGFDTWDTTGGRWTLPPTLPLIIALFRFLGASLEWSGHLASVFAGTLLLFPIYYLTRRFYSGKISIVAACIGAFTPILVDYSVVILTECLFAFFVLMMMLFIARGFSSKGGIIDVLVSGIFCGLAFLTKTFGIFLLPFLLAGYLFGKGGNSKLSPIKQTGFALLGFLILAIPYWIFLFRYTGEFVMDGKGIGQEIRIWARDLDEEHIDPRYTGELTLDKSDFAININPHGIKPEWASTGWLIKNFPRKYLQKLVRVYQDFPFTPTYPNGVYLLYLFPAILLGLGIFSGTGSIRERHGDRFFLYWLCPIIFGLPLIFVEVRYYIPAVAVMVPLMAKGAGEIAHWAVRSFQSDRLSAPKLKFESMLLLVVLIFIILALPKISYKITHKNDPFVSYNPRKEAANYLNAKGIHPERIMEYAHSVSFYSGAQSILIPESNLDGIFNIAKKYDVEYLSLDEFYLLRSHRRPQTEFLFDNPDNPPNGLELVYYDNKYPGLKHIIYRISPTAK